MNLPDFEALLTPTGQTLIAQAAALAPTEASFLTCLARLKHAPPALAKAALETAILRTKAREKFARAESMYFTREALEQATREPIARYRAARFAPFDRVAELGCGIGGDTLGLAQYTTVLAFEQEALRLRMAEQNMIAYAVADRVTFRPADITQMPFPVVPAAFCDPARRSDQRRRFSVRDYEPSLEAVTGWLAHTPAIGVKISPGVNVDEIRQLDCEVEFISFAGELKECVLWFGPLKTAHRRATLLPGPHTLIADDGEPIAPRPPRAYLYEPDPAILRAGLVTTLAAQLNATQIDPDIAYLTSDELTPTPWATPYRVQAAFPFSLKRLRQYVREHHIGQVTVKKRGSPLEPEALIKQLKPSGPESAIVFLTHVQGEPYVVMAKACFTQ